jgi:uncharacterized ferritin-like protein (DUF455 family)
MAMIDVEQEQKQTQREGAPGAQAQGRRGAIVGTGLRAQALAALCESDPLAKAQAVMALAPLQAQLPLELHQPAPATAHAVPGRPGRPVLRAATEVPQRSVHTPTGRAALLHAIAHIEFNAINLALDAAWRFDPEPDQLPRAYYDQWLRVAADEARHFLMLRSQLQAAGFDYGHFDAHDGLWSLCERTAHDVLARMAVVPRTMEARGLDATPLIQRKLRAVGTPDALQAVQVLDVILHDEIGHVAVGNRWFDHVCQRRGLDRDEQDITLRRAYGAPEPRPPINRAARRAAGFTEAELARWPQTST